MNSQKIVMCGCHEAGWETVKFLLESGVRISYFVSISPEKAEKLSISGYKSFDDLATKYDIPLYYPQKYSLTDKQDIEFFKQHRFDLLVQGGWQRLFPDEILRTLRVGAIGVHGSSEFLPLGRGRSPINWSLIEGKRRFIFHYFIMRPGIDDGDIFHYEMVDINEWDDCRTLYYKNSIVTRQVLLKWIPRLLDGNYACAPQQGDPSYYPKRVHQDGQIDWSKTVFDIYNFVRALTTPYPGAFTFLDNEKVFIWKSQPFDTRICYPGSDYGEVVEVFSGGSFIVNCRSGLLLVTECDHQIQIGQVFRDSSYENK